MHHLLRPTLLTALVISSAVVCGGRPDGGRGRAGWIVALAFAPDSRTLASAGHGETLKLWDVRTGRLVRAINIYPEGSRARGIVGSVAFAPDGRSLAAGTHYALLRSWDAATGAPLRAYRGYVCGLRCSSAPFSPDGKVIAGADADTGAIKLWDAASGRLLRTFAAARDRRSDAPHNAEHILFSPDGARLYADGGPAGPVRVWDVATGRELLRFKTGAVVKAMALSPDGRTLMIGGSLPEAPRGARGVVAFLDAESGRPQRVLPPQRGEVTGVAFAPDGRLAAEAAYEAAGGVGVHAVKLWDAETGEEVRRLVGHAEAVDAVAFSPDGKTIATGGRDAAIKLWDVATGRELRSLPAGAEARGRRVAPPRRRPAVRGS